jgi:hypothetical protein
MAVSLSYAQETMLVNQKLPNKLVAVYNVLKSDIKIKQGLYQVRRDKKTAIVSGVYTNNKRTGLWHFFDSKGTLIENFNYDTNELTYEAPDTRQEGFKYVFDKDFTSTDTITKPIRVGGRYYGYLPYLNLFKKPKDLNTIDQAYLNVYIELLISPGGVLADYNIHISSDYYNFERTLNVNLDLLPLDDKIFIPATINRQPVASRITIPCLIDNSGNGLVF